MTRAICRLRAVTYVTQPMSRMPQKSSRLFSYAARCRPHCILQNGRGSGSKTFWLCSKMSQVWLSQCVEMNLLVVLLFVINVIVIISKSQNEHKLKIIGTIFIHHSLQYYRRIFVWRTPVKFDNQSWGVSDFFFKMTANHFELCKSDSFTYWIRSH